MPTILSIFGLRFFFYTREHVENKGLKPATLRLAESILEENRVNFINEWNKTFNM